MRSQIYFPIERAKAGEFSSKAVLAQPTKKLICPTFDLPGTDSFGEFELLQSTVASSLARTWGTANELYLDLSRYDPDLLTSDGDPYVTLLFKSAHQAGLKAIPVMGPALERRGATGAYLQGVADIVARDGRGMAIRVPYDDLVQAERLHAVIDEVQGIVGSSDSDCDVFLDVGSVDRLPGGLQRAEAVLRETLLPTAQAICRRRFRALVLCASSIPRHPKQTADGSPTRVANIEYQVWSELISSKDCRHIRFGDYGARYANQSDKKQKARAPARIQLATPDRHVLFIGPGKSYRELAKKAVDCPEFAKQCGVWGKHAVRDSASGRGGVGNSTDWVARDAHMHAESMVRAVGDRLTEMSVPIAVAAPVSVDPLYQIDLGV